MKFEMNTGTTISLIVEIFGGVLVLITFFGLRNQTRELMKMDDEELIPEEITAKFIYFLNLRLVGTAIIAISGLVRIFIRATK